MKFIRRFFLVFVILLVIGGLAAIWLFNESTTEALPPDGPHKVQVRIAHIKAGDRDMPVMVWYPQPLGGREGYVYNTNIQGTAHLAGATADSDAPYPLIVFSHGIGECGDMGVFFTENLASFGYVVMAPDHKDSMMCSIEGEPKLGFADLSEAAVFSGMSLFGTVDNLFGDYLESINYDLTYRPREVSAVIDKALEWNADPGSYLSGMIDPDRIGVAGHSLGGFTTLLIGGLPFLCDSVDTGDCSGGRMDVTDIKPCCVDTFRNMPSPTALGDGRVKAILVMSPAMFFEELDKAAKELKIPIMLIAGDDKRFEVPFGPIRELYEDAPPPKYLILQKDTDHMLLADFLRTRKITRPIYPGYRFNYKEKAQSFKDYPVAFFDLYLKGDNTGAATLDGPINEFVEVWSERGAEKVEK